MDSAKIGGDFGALRMTSPVKNYRRGLVLGKLAAAGEHSRTGFVTRYTPKLLDGLATAGREIRSAGAGCVKSLAPGSRTRAAGRSKKHVSLVRTPWLARIDWRRPFAGRPHGA